MQGLHRYPIVARERCGESRERSASRYENRHLDRLSKLRCMKINVKRHFGCGSHGVVMWSHEHRGLAVAHPPTSHSPCNTCGLEHTQALRPRTYQWVIPPQPSGSRVGVRAKGLGRGTTAAAQSRPSPISALQPNTYTPPCNPHFNQAL